MQSTSSSEVRNGEEDPQQWGMHGKSSINGISSMSANRNPANILAYKCGRKLALNPLDLDLLFSKEDTEWEVIGSMVYHIAIKTSITNNASVQSQRTIWEETH